MSGKKIKSIDTNGDTTTITYEDGSTETQTSPVQVDRLDNATVTVRLPWNR
ncbi:MULTISPECIES: hypothetical protein [unclassified Nocardiopsis]|uniref:hypothetical protein n=1 Tax=Nocardiopsis TaxID=2013 RepID=UPI00387B0038